MPEMSGAGEPDQGKELTLRFQVSLQLWDELDFYDDDLWESFKEEYGELTEQDFKLVPNHYLRKMRNFLRQRGVWILKDRNVTISKSLTNTLEEKEPTEWKEEEITAGKANEDFTSKAIKYLIATHFGRKPDGTVGSTVSLVQSAPNTPRQLSAVSERQITEKQQWQWSPAPTPILYPSVSSNPKPLAGNFQLETGQQSEQYYQPQLEQQYQQPPTSLPPLSPAISTERYPLPSSKTEIAEGFIQEGIEPDSGDDLDKTMEAFMIGVPSPLWSPRPEFAESFTYVGTSKDMESQMDIKTSNGTAGANELVPTLLLFGSYFCMHNLNPPAPIISQRARAIQRATSKTRKGIG